MIETGEILSVVKPWKFINLFAFFFIVLEIQKWSCRLKDNMFYMHGCLCVLCGRWLKRSPETRGRAQEIRLVAAAPLWVYVCLFVCLGFCVSSSGGNFIAIDLKQTNPFLQPLEEKKQIAPWQILTMLLTLNVFIKNAHW